MEPDDKSPDASPPRNVALAARATIELFGNGAIAKARERLAEVEASGDEQGAGFWRALLKEVTRLHLKRHEF